MYVLYVLYTTPKFEMAPATQRANLSMKPVKVNACERAGRRALGTSPHEGTQGLAAVSDQLLSTLCRFRPLIRADSGKHSHRKPNDMC